MNMMLIVDELALEFEGKAEVISLNAAVDNNAQLQADYSLRGHPSIVILDSDGQISQRIFGPAPIDELRDAVAEVIEGK